MIRISIPGNPIAKARPRFARRGKFVTTYNPQETEEGFWVLQAMEQIKKSGVQTPIQGPVSIACSLAFQRPKSHFGAKGVKPSAPTSHTQKPDCDNTIKFVMDALTRCGVWNDDTQVVQMGVEKYWVDKEPMTSITIKPEWP